MKKSYVLAAAIAMGVYGSSEVAFAGHWEKISDQQLTLSDRMRGSGHVEYYDYSTTPPTFFRDDIDWLSNGWGVPYGDFFVSGQRGGYIEQGIDGAVRSKFTWVPDYVGDPPTDSINLLVTAEGYVMASSDMDGAHRNKSKEHLSFSSTVEGKTDELDPANEFDTWDVIGLVKGNLHTARRLISYPTNGQSEVWGPWVEIKSTVRVDGDRTAQVNGSTVYLRGATWLSGVILDSVPDNRKVYISSTNIQPSYRKTSDTTQPLWKYRYGAPPNSSDLIGDIPVGLLNERNPDGSITIDSVAVWDGFQWYGQGIFKANAVNFTSPTYKWNWSGGSIIGPLSDDISNGEEELNATPNLLYGTGVRLGGDEKGSGMQANSIINLTATDSDYTAGSNQLTVNWHLPLEEEAKLRNNDKGSTIDIVSSWGTVERSIQFVINPRNVAWDVIEVGAGLAAIAGDVLVPNASVATKTALALMGAGFVIDNIVPQSETRQITFDYPEYVDAVQNQVKKNNDQVGSSGLPVEDQPDTFFSETASDLDDHAATLYLDSNGNAVEFPGTNDPNYDNAILQSRIVVARVWEEDLWRGFLYDTQGFDKYITYPIKQDVSFVNIFQVKVP